MQQQVHRYFIGAVAFGAVVVTATSGILIALAAAASCAAAVFAVGRMAQRRPRPVARPKRVAARRVADEDERHPLVPDDPSLILTTYS